MTHNAAILTDVSLRDGLQALGYVVPTARKIQMIEALLAAGCRRLEVASFVNQQLVPTMADAEEICRRLPRKPGVEYAALALDAKGMARMTGVDSLHWVGVAVASSDTFLTRNQRCDRVEAMGRLKEIEGMRAGMPLRLAAYVSCCFACPYEGPVDPRAVADICDDLHQLGADEIYLADTIGKGTAPATRKLLDLVLRKVPVERIGVHFHDTFGQALANIDVALGYGIRHVDAAAAGLGGCMFAKGATGNVASEDVAVLLGAYGLETQLDAIDIARAGQSLCRDIGVENHSRAGRALLRSLALDGAG